MNNDHVQYSLTNGEKKFIFGYHVWLVEVNHDLTRKINLKSETENTLIIIPAGEKYLLIMNNVLLEVISGSLYYRELNIIVMTKLLAFIDRSLHYNFIKVYPQCRFFYLSVEEKVSLKKDREIEYWLIKQALFPKSGSEIFIAFLRNTEWYWLVHFLLIKCTDNNKLQELCKIYGLSASHFRRLCRHSLGTTTKIELRNWRMARAVLSLIEEEKTITNIAINNGYASLSHFSNELKGIIGISPQKLRNIMNNSYLK